MLNHLPPRLVGTYDLYERMPEMKRALDMWSEMLISLGATVEPVKLLAPPMRALPAPQVIAPTVDAAGC